MSVTSIAFGDEPRKSAFMAKHPGLEIIREMPDSEPEAVVSAARERGIILTETRVKKVRAADRARATREENEAAFAADFPRAKDVPSMFGGKPPRMDEETSESQDRIAFRRLLVRLGIRRFEEMLAEAKEDLEDFVEDM